MRFVRVAAYVSDVNSSSESRSGSAGFVKWSERNTH